MRTTLNLQPEAHQLVESLAQQRACSLGDAASELILQARTARRRSRTRNGVPLVGDGVVMTAAEVSQALDDDP